jgi:hypothetical protein
MNIYIDGSPEGTFWTPGTVLRDGARLRTVRHWTEGMPKKIGVTTVKASAFMAFQDDLVRDEQVTTFLHKLHERIRYRILPLFNPFLH